MMRQSDENEILKKIEEGEGLCRTGLGLRGENPVTSAQFAPCLDEGEAELPTGNSTLTCRAPTNWTLQRLGRA